MRGIKRIYIDIDWDRLKQLHPNIDELQARCMQEKWSPFKDWEQGFDSDCFGHCSGFEDCRKAFYDKEIKLENHFKEIIIPSEEKLFWGDKEVEIKELT